MVSFALKLSVEGRRSQVWTHDRARLRTVWPLLHCFSSPPSGRRAARSRRDAQDDLAARAPASGEFESLLDFRERQHGGHVRLELV